MEWLREEFDRCWPWLEGSLEAYGKTHTKEQLWEVILYRKAFFWPGESCAILANIITYPACPPRLNLWLMGGNLKEIVKMVPAVEAFGKQKGCDRVIACGRRGWLRVLDGYQEYGTRRFKRLRESEVGES